MAPAALSKGVVTFLFTDIAGSTRLWERAPDAMALALERHDHVLRTILTKHGGTVFKTVGDAFCCSFEVPEAAVRAAIAAQRALSAEQWPEALGHVRTRIPVVTREGNSDKAPSDWAF